ncbi:hypothetical protein HYE68_001194 [Fusarium pseudograminearum]|nr:hypothetical protein HYE68_001194 [Fusarium pseudograminearum]
MSNGQKDSVKETVAEYGEHRPRPTPEWLAYCKKLFIDVWLILFPKDQFPHFNEPLSPFYADDDEIPDLCQYLVQKVGILVEPLLQARAEQAVRDKAIASTTDFVLSAEGMKAVMSETIAIALRSSPAATGATQWAVRATSEMLQNAAGQIRDENRGDGEGEDEDESDNHGSSTPSDSATAPRTPGPTEDTVPKEATPQPTIHVRLFPEGTRVTIDLVPDTPETRSIQLSHPSIVYVAKMSQSPIPSASAPVPSTPPVRNDFGAELMNPMDWFIT